jgi:heme A synthase
MNISRVNKGMSLEDFKFIYWMEYAHRMWGRALGFLFAFPFAYFVAKGYVTRQLGLRLSALFALGGGQGLIGWWMVKSGLEVLVQFLSCLTTWFVSETSQASFLHFRNQHLSTFNQGLALTGWRLT